MTRWATVVLVATAVAAGLFRAEGVIAGDVREAASLLLSELPALDAATLDAQSARGIDNTPGGLDEPDREFGVILWDELKPARPGAPKPQPTPGGQGLSRVNATAN